ncbi:MAG: ferredoxin [Clostridia bacterium]|nr:ferredoxin [Clostridia bacterium]MBQ3755423.1 ferredoxin [Clostridia bacterium]
MRAYVDKELCIGCGFCVSCCPEVFRQDETEKAEVYADTTDENKEQVQEAIDGCPVCAISE